MAGDETNRSCELGDVAAVTGGSGRRESRSPGFVGEFRDLLGKYTDLPSAPTGSCEAFAACLRGLADAIESPDRYSVDEVQRPVKEESGATCMNCKDRSTCKELCPTVLAQLPGIHAGRGRKENTPELHEESLEKREVSRRSDIFYEYEKYKDIFTEKQWQVISLYYDIMTASQTNLRYRIALARAEAR